MRYSVCYILEKEGKDPIKKFEVIEYESKNRDSLFSKIQKKHKGYNVTIKYAKEIINAQSGNL